METPAVPTVTFDSFGLRAEVTSVLKALGYEEPTPIQRETIPALMAGKDVLGQAATGTGKTAAFALPMLERVNPKDRKPFQVQALVLVPTRELAMQVAEAIQKYGGGLGVTSLAVYGGQEIFNQIRPLKRGVDIVIATPGRALDHIERKTLLLDKVKVVVLDEADEMLDMGFEEDLQKILGELPKERQTALFSATLPSRIAKIAEKHLKNPVRVSIAARSLEAGTAPKIRQSAFVVQRKMKEAALMRVLEWETPQSAIIFCRTRTEVEALNHVLMRAGYEPAALHGGLTQEQRDQVLRRFKEGAVRVLVATDVAARGLHVEALSHVVNFDLPTSPEVYVHRIGRTGRAGKEGVALSFLDPREQRLLKNVEFQIKARLPISQVPTRAQLDARRAETVAKKVSSALSDEGVEHFIELAKKAAGDASMEQVAGAAMLLLQRKLFPPHESDAVDFGKNAGPAAARERSDRGARPERGERGERGERNERRDRPERGEGPPRERRERAGPREGMTALALSLGERAGIRPQDLVGAIANEAGIPSRVILGVRIDELTSRVEVPSESVHDVIKALHATRIRGRKVRVSIEGAESESAPVGSPVRAPKKTAPRSAPRAAPVEESEEAPEGERAPVRAPRKTAPRSGGGADPVEEAVEAPEVEATEEGEEAPIAGRWMISDELESELDEKAPPPSAPRAEADAQKPPRKSAPRAAPAADADQDEAPQAPRKSAPRAAASDDAEEEAPQAPRKSAPRAEKTDKPRFGKPRPGDRFGGKSEGGKPRGDHFGKSDDKPRGDHFGKSGGSSDKPRGDRFGKSGGNFDKRGDRFGKSGGNFGDKPRGDRFGKSDDKPRGDHFGKSGGEFGDKPRGDHFGKSGGEFGDKPRGDRFRKSGGAFGDKPRGDHFGKSGGEFGDKPRGDRFGKSGGEFGDKPRGDRFGKSGGEFGDKPRGDRFGKSGGSFGDKPRGDRFGKSGGEFGEKPIGKSGGSFGRSDGDKPRGGFGGKPGGKSDNFGRRPPGTFGGEGGPPPRPSAGRFSSDKSRAQGFSPKPRFGDRPGSSSQRSGGQSAPKRREFGPPSGPETPARFSAPPKKKHGRMG